MDLVYAQRQIFIRLGILHNQWRYHLLFTLAKTNDKASRRQGCATVITVDEYTSLQKMRYIGNTSLPPQVVV